MRKNNTTVESIQLLRKLEQREGAMRIEETNLTGNLAALFEIDENELQGPKQVDHASIRRILKTVIVASVLIYALMMFVPVTGLFTIAISVAVLLLTINSFRYAHKANGNMMDKDLPEVIIYSLGITNLAIAGLYTIYYLASSFTLYVEANQPAIKALYLFLTQ